MLRVGEAISVWDRKISVPSPQFYCKTKAKPINKGYNKKLVGRKSIM
jgi:hypothetical protein